MPVNRCERIADSESMKMMLAPVLELRYRLSEPDCRKEERLLNKEKDMNSEELLRLLFMESSLEHLMTMDTGEVGMPTFAEYITQLARSMGEAPERVINRADLDKSYGHHCVRIPGRLRQSADIAQNSEKIAPAPPRQAGHGHHLLPAPRLQHCRDPVSPQ